MLQDNLLKIANKYYNDLVDSNLECYLKNETNIAYVFKTALNDYKRMLKQCKKEGIDVGDDVSEIDSIVYEYKISEFKSDKTNLISRIKDRVICLIEICDEIPPFLDKRYRKDLVEMFDPKR